MTFKFGDVLENGWASTGNPTRTVIFVRRSGAFFKCIDSRGKEVTHYADNERLIKVGNVLDADSMKKFKKGEYITN